MKKKQKNCANKNGNGNSDGDGDGSRIAETLDMRHDEREKKNITERTKN